MGRGKLTTRPLTLARWGDLKAVFNARGCSVARGCWCMYYRRTGAQSFPDKKRAQANRAQLKALVRAGKVPGLIAYRNGVPAGWVSMGPREDYAKLARSPVMRPVDHKPVWSIICFVVPSEFRRQGVARALLAGAIALRAKTRRETRRGLSGRQARPLGRRLDVVWREVDVRRGGILGGGAPQAAAAHRAPRDVALKARARRQTSRWRRALRCWFDWIV